MQIGAGQLPASRRSPLRFAINIEGGVGALSIEGHPLSALGRIERLRMNVPDLRFPFDLSKGAAGFRNRRCDLRMCEVSVGGAELRRYLRNGAPLARLGFSRLAIDLAAPAFSAAASLVVDGREVDFHVSGLLRVAGGRYLRLALYDLRVFGFVPIAAPVLALALLQGATGIDGKDPMGAAGAARHFCLRGPTELEIDVLDVVLFDLLPSRGWRLPARAHLRLAPPSAEPDRVVLRFSPGAGLPDDEDDFGFSDPSTRSGWFSAYEEGRGLFPEGESALLEGDSARALAVYRRAVALHPLSTFLSGRLLHLLSASKETLAEAEELASALLAQRPRFVPALLVRAIAAGQAGRAAEAAELYRMVAEESAPLPALEAAAALRTAAEWHLHAGQYEAARDLLERIRTQLPGHAGALDLLRRCHRAEGRFEEWLSVLRQQELDEPDTRQRARLIGEAGRVLLENLGQAKTAGERFAEAIVLDEEVAEYWEGLGRAQVRTGELAAAQTSLERALALCGPADSEEEPARALRLRVLRTLGEIAEARGDLRSAEVRFAEAQSAGDHDSALLSKRAQCLAAQDRQPEAIALLETAVAAARDPAHVAELRVELAGLLARQPEARARARARVELERVLSEQPAHAPAISLLVTLSDATSAAELLPIVQRAIERGEDPEALRAIIASARGVAEQAGRPTFVVDTLMATARAGTRSGAEAARQLALLALQSESVIEGERTLGEIMTLVERHTSTPVAIASTLRADLGRLLSALRERCGDDEGALRALELCLAADPPAEIAVAAWRRIVELKARAGDAAGAARALIASADDPRTAQPAPARAALLVAAAEILRERLQLPLDALPLLERATILDPLNIKAFEALEISAEAAEDWPRLAEVIARRAERARLTERRTQLGRLARVLSEKLGRHEEAAQAYRRALEIDPEYGPALLWLARFAWARGDTEESVQMYRRLAGMRGRTGAGGVGLEDYSEAHLRLAQYARVLGRVNDVEFHMKSGLANEPEHGAPTEVLVDALESLGEMEGLADALRARVAREQQPARRRQLEAALARVLEQTGHVADAVAIYQRVLDERPDDIDTMGRLAELYRREGRWAEVTPILERLLNAAAQHPDAIDQNAVAIDLARALAHAGRDVGRAERLLRDLLASNPSSREAAEALGRLLLARGAWQEADHVLAAAGILRTAGDEARPLDISPGPRAVDGDAALAAARARLEAGAGEVAAYAVLRPFVLERLPPAALALRGQLAGKLGETEDLSAVLARFSALWANDQSEALRELAQRLCDAAVEHRETWEPAILLLESLVETGAHDREALERLAAQYALMDDPRARGRAVHLFGGRTGLVGGERVLALAEKLAALAEAEGDLGTAERYWANAAGLDIPPAARARCLTERARLCVALGDVQSASTDLQEALAIDADQPAALALYGELAYRAADWAEARRIYTRLARVPSVEGVIDPVTLSLRRAELAETFGDEAEAEACYRDVIARMPEHTAAREALAAFAAYRGDLSQAVILLEGALSDAFTGAAGDVGRVMALRERLADLQVRTGSFGAARAQVEKVLLIEPDRITSLELLARACEGAGDFKQAAQVWGRLARLLGEDSKRAEALFRQGEILRLHLGDLRAADDAYLRSSDIDPTFVPTLLRLVHVFWREGDLKALLDVTQDVLKQPAGLAALGGDVAGWLSAFAALSVEDPGLARRVAPERLLEGATAALLELARRNLDQRPSVLDAALDLVLERVEQEPGLVALQAELRRCLDRSPLDLDVGALALYARICERAAALERARGAYAVLCVRGADPRAEERLAELARAPHRIDEAALSPNAALHPVVAQAARRVLTALAPVLVGWAAEPEAGEGVEPDADVSALVRSLAVRLHCPPVVPRLVPGASVELRAGSPVRVEIGADLQRLNAPELAFSIAIALDRVRSATFVVERISDEQFGDLFAGIAAGLRGSGVGPEMGLRGQIAALLGQHARLLPGTAERERLFDDVLELVEAPPDRRAYLADCQQLACRVALLVCGDPLVALRAVAARSGVTSPAFGALARFVVSDLYG